MRYALRIEYDGTDFHGSQLQKGVRTVQGDLETALAQVYAEAPRVFMASRTDAGVHALGQVAAFDADESHDAETIRDALNFHLEKDVAVKESKPAKPQFDPRREALEREYVFTLNDGPVRSPLSRLREVKTKELVNFEDMRSAATSLVGSHDFASFAGPATPRDASTVRLLTSIEMERTGETTSQVRIVGNAFVHQQVRRMTGALVRVGTGRMTPDELNDLIEKPRRGAANWLLGPEGLCLTRIEYGKDGPFRTETEYN